LAKPEIAPFDPLTRKTPSWNQTWSKSDDLPRRYRHFSGILCILAAILDYGRHIGFEAKFKVAQKHFSNSMV